MATIQPLKEDQNRSVLLVTGTGSESGTVVVNGAALAGAIQGATGPLGFYDYQVDRKSTRLNSSHMSESRMPSSA